MPTTDEPRTIAMIERETALAKSAYHAANAVEAATLNRFAAAVKAEKALVAKRVYIENMADFYAKLVAATFAATDSFKAYSAAYNAAEAAATRFQTLRDELAALRAR